MIRRFIAVVCAVVVLSAIARADEVDDLLAGKPLPIDAQKPEGRLPEVAPTIDDSFLPPLEKLKVADEPSWDATVGATASTRLSQSSPDQPDRSQPAPSASVTMVPEPQAFALAGLALLYFLIFFRRRHLA